MLPVDKRVFEPEEMVVVVLVQLGVQLVGPVSKHPFPPTSIESQTLRTYQIKNRHLHHTLVEVSCAVLDNLDSNDLLSLHVLALNDLAEGALAKNVEDQIPIPRRAISHSTDHPSRD